MFLYSKNCLNSPQICAVKERNPTEMRDLPSRYVEIGIQSAKYCDHMENCDRFIYNIKMKYVKSTCCVR